MNACRTAVILMAVLLGLPAQPANCEDAKQPRQFKLSDSLTCTLDLDPEPHFTISGFKQQPSEDADLIFQVVVHRANEPNTPPILGTYKFEDGTLSFFPRFPLSPSVAYAVRLGDSLSASASTQQPLLFELSRTNQEPRRVDAVYPSAAELPENLLKFYIHFSGPMNRGEAYQRIQLSRGENPVDGPFLELGEELWDPRQTRFTLFIHPGRIKRGLKPHEDDGPAISVGEEYSLRINQAWTAANGEALESDFVKKFSVIPADHAQPTPEKWQIKTPGKNTLDPVGLIFDEPLDHAMLSRVLTVKNRLSETIDGSISITDNETVWEFVPAKPWPVGTYNIEVAANLEDLCGNSIARPFEVKMQAGAAALPSTKVAIEFIVK